MKVSFHGNLLYSSPSLEDKHGIVAKIVFEHRIVGHKPHAFVPGFGRSIDVIQANDALRMVRRYWEPESLALRCLRRCGRKAAR